jgi:hypothetical protein
VTFKIATIGCALIAMSAPALAQDRASHAPRGRTAQDGADESVFEAGVANLTVRAAFSPSASLSRQELLSLLLLMSVPRETARNSMEGTKP